MDSPYLHFASQQPQRIRTNSNLSVHSHFHSHSIADQRGAIRKPSLDRSRSVSTSQVDRLQQLALGSDDPSSTSEFRTIPSNTSTNTSAFHWITPRHSPQPQAYFPHQQSIETFPTWSVPTPPPSDSGRPLVSVDAGDEGATTGINTSQPGFVFDQPTSAEMSSLGLLLPSQYGGPGLFESEPASHATMEQKYIPPMKVSQPSMTLGQSAYAHTTSSSPALYQSRSVPEGARGRRQSELPVPANDQAYTQSYRRISNPYETASSGQYSAATSQTIPSISGLTHSPMPSPHGGTYPGAEGMSHHHHSSLTRPPATYDNSPLYPHSYPSASAAQSHLYTPHSTAQSLSYPPVFMSSTSNYSHPSVADLLATSKPPSTTTANNSNSNPNLSLPSAAGGDSSSSIRILAQRPKPQCWDHGCNGRQFSTFSNLLRHQREKSGTAPKSYCRKCGAEFTRTTARNGHMAHDKCTATRGVGGSGGSGREEGEGEGEE
ncbi:hypothetical protein LTR91_024229 [Friedmanniomyces endolithicus]|uniref:C2H2-type domain-containing protein n=1 Tax=Friedmanniomyces endolithicus TaxID=329885 RepID=A0AAN6JXM1_9PEZI|nr:hypothetical protein LTR57_008366 [Friedmanniomyces endolithicus]KAK0952744.1 hypothetical protein LTR91_024229 [Friedmanniomyces endolithicus]KAK1048090.1 hypothetical protein LTS16_004612 [Friedmanniomyces endolithicus]